jgi:peptidoglycan/LPS O-acetylase OafA/YrhL
MNVSSRLRLAELDGLRGIAIASVLIWHYLGIPLPPAGVAIASPETWLPDFKQSLVIFRSGVDLFFVLSGFLIGGILVDYRSSPNYYRTFYLRRICRIFPLYYGLVAWFIVARALGAEGELFDGPIPALAYLSFTQNYFMVAHSTYGAAWLGATWSLAIEEQFYLLFPFIVRWTRSSLPWLLACAVLGAPVLRIWSYVRYGGDDFPAYMWLPCRIDALSWGALLAFMIRTESGRGWILRSGRLLWWSFGCLLAAVLVFAAVLARNIGYHMTFWGHTLLAAFYALSILLAFVHAGSWWTGFLRWRPLVWLGQVSYGVYLVHGIMLIAVFELAGRKRALESVGDCALMGVALASTLAICAVSYRWLERPIIQAGHRLSYD